MRAARRALLAAAAVVLTLGVAGALVVERPSRLDDAIAHLGDGERFSTSQRAGQTVADISVALREDGAACRSQREEGPRCEALLSAAAFTAVTAVTMLDCTAPDVYDARVALRAYLRDLRTFLDAGASGLPPRLPKVIAC